MAVDYAVEIGKSTMNFNTGHLAKQANGATVVSLGETVVFASVVVSDEVRDGQDFFPLTVDYREKAYAGGNIPGGFIKRESRPSDREILTCRITDRPLRPLFPKGFLNEVQIIIYVLSSDKLNQPDVLAINAASASLMISGAPFGGPVGAVRMGRVDGEWIVNPTYEDDENSDIDLVVAGTKKAVTMIEGSAKNIPEEDILQAIELAHENIKLICAAQEEFAAKVPKSQMKFEAVKDDEDLKNELKEKYFSEIEAFANFKEKTERDDSFKALYKKAKEEMTEKYPDFLGQIWEILDSFDGEVLRKRILDEKVRADGRALDEIREITCETGNLPRTHGSAVFTRGSTQSLGVTTLGTASDAQRFDFLEGKKESSFMLHYNFPPFSVGETGRTGGLGRREIGHGMLAERALKWAIPGQDKFPYTIRQVSETMESNGSSSMASVCSGSLAMFNAGVPLKAAVAGIAMGLVKEDDNFAVLSDILGLEDHHGDMDFKVAGTTEGITAFQLDIKIEGITLEIMKVALEQAKVGRLHILNKMSEVMSVPDENVSEHAPKIKIIQINPDKIGEVIGPGGKNIKRIIEESGANINIVDSGEVTISAVSQESIDKAIFFVKGIVDDVEVGTIYDGTVKKVLDFGAFVEIIPGKEGLVHISNLAHERVKVVTDVLNVGDKVKVKVIKIDKQGRIDLSRKEALEK